MIGPGRALAAASLLGVASGCFEPAYETCRAACTSDADCAPGHACGAAGLCAPGDDLLACGGPPVPEPMVSPAGMYSFLLTNRENGCDFPDWNSGATSSCAVKIGEDKLIVTAEMQGNLGSILNSWLGSNKLKGPYQGARVELVLMGTKFTSQSSCTYTFDVTIDATLDGDLLAGSLFYRARTNGASGCGGLTGCASRQELRGTRPPPPPPP